ncbi:hypothetical protein MMC22_000633 [Lobaria immixta]|nr:hypothetical protein [Lobaria immixta]
MGKPPAVVIIARHGARLDAADSQWHLTSPTPYDPPLTYGGWKQAQALGGRIATILRSRETLSDTELHDGILKNPGLAALDGLENGKEGSHSHQSQPGRRRKQRLIIHSSPFLRCVQTSIAISAGLEQSQGLHNASSQSSHPKPHTHPHQMHSGSPHLRAMDHWHSPYLSAIPEPGENEIEPSRKSQAKPTSTSKARLRVDAFLGEWLSPDYFEEITPPADSVMMIASAKADLLRQGEHLEILQSTNGSTLSHGNFPGGWGSGRSMASASAEDGEDGPLGNMSDLSQRLPRFSRSQTHTGSAPLGIRASHNTTRAGEKVVSNVRGYTPPTPAYAISPSDPIPLGYVAHARDACVDVDYQWDSMRLPHDWGDGGCIGEEWSSMHKRFRRGLHNMINWYRGCDTRTREENIREDATRHAEPNVEPSEGHEEETDTILVLVTHGAGCNALIGALTNQPVLMNVGMASLTMAVRKENPITSKFSLSSSSSSSDASTTASQTRRRSIIDLGISDDYDVKIIASTDHLRLPSQPSPASLTQHSPIISSTYIAGNRHRSGSPISTGSGGSTSDGIFSLDHDDAVGGNAAAPTGLWTKPVTQPTRPQRRSNSTQDPYARDRARSDERTSAPAGGEPGSKNGVQDSLTKNGFVQPSTVTSALPVYSEGDRFATQPGLWGAAPVAVGTAREKGPKRRWTHSEHK